MSPFAEGKQELLRRARTASLFASAPEAVWEQLSHHLSFPTYPGETVLQEMHSMPSVLSGVLQGWMQSYAPTPFGEQHYGSLRAGDLFGELPMIDGQEDPSAVKASSEVQLWSIEHEPLRQLCLSSPAFACQVYRGFWRSLADKIQRSNEQMKKFFGADTHTAPASEVPRAKAPSRPAWFAPPEGIRTTSSGSLPVIAKYMRDSEKRRVFEEIGLVASEIDILFAHGEEMHLPASSVVFHEGDFGDTLYFILQGEARISKKIQGVGEEALAILHAGQFFGEMALVADNAVRSADCFAHEGPLTLLAFRQHLLHSYDGIAETDPLFLQALCKMMALRLRENYAKLFNWRMMSGGF
ncbi:MAG: cyclic nucleotide-binding domain-containing protein [Myxococcales bacterium]|nr:cyclic nucleotide-binding domain-containing protein [Myxococcales bacterium]MCB9643684.1 cyclic nucleotide-binding domain-containing protein [Myxococcales bacterium]